MCNRRLNRVKWAPEEATLLNTGMHMHSPPLARNKCLCMVAPPSLRNLLQEGLHRLHDRPATGATTISKKWLRESISGCGRCKQWLRGRGSRHVGPARSNAPQHRSHTPSEEDGNLICSRDPAIKLIMRNPDLVGQRLMSLQGYLAHKKQPPPPTTTVGALGIGLLERHVGPGRGHAPQHRSRTTGPLLLLHTAPLQGYLAHKKHTTPLGPPHDFRHRPTVGS